MSLQGFRNKLVVPAGPPALNFSHPAMGAGGKAARLVAVPNPGGGFLDLLTGKVSVTQLAGGTTSTTPTNVPGMGPAIHVPSITGGTQNSNITFPSLISGESSTSWMLAQIGRSTGSGGGGLTSLYWSAGNTTPGASISIASTILSTGSGVTIGSFAIPQSHPVFAVMTRPVANNTCIFLVRDLITGQIFVTSTANNTTFQNTITNYSLAGLGNTTALPTVADLGPAFFGVGFMPLNQLIAWAMDPWSLWYGRNSDVASITSLTGPPPPAAAFTTWSPSDKSVSVTLSNGNLTANNAASSLQGVRSVDRVYHGKYYWEVSYDATNGSAGGVGVANGYITVNAGATAPNTASNFMVIVNPNGNTYAGGSTVGTPSFGTIATGSIICFALDLDSRQLWIRVGATGNWNNNAAYAPGGVGGISVPLLGSAYGAYAYANFTQSAAQYTANFGATAFAGAVPSGYQSGFPGSTTLISSEVVTQMAAEDWARITPPQMQLTQVAVEEWVSVNPYVPPASNSAALLMGL